ncbi:hypothetical protein GCK72_024384 [Caenorhabditis remanei]|uniref:Uncharacterized protein n=1 Tax=Caenorhabditis remanei TaxID=31234 RepID=A0A6A5FZ39_CAERE|nr:hypothetical protein GCK72_024384 [Caenorhabditis remanei]KAF1747918.1 hypothetical protein GCK72_024384 [Caenorhabditis remanei]
MQQLAAKKRLRSPHSLQQRPQSPGRHRILDVSPHRRQRSRDVRKRQVEEKKKPYVRTDTTSKELTFPAIATQKCLSLLEFTEKRGLTITDEELLLVVRDCLELDKAMDNIIDKKDLMIKQLEEMRDFEYLKIKKIHANMPRHMQDVLKFDGKTVHIAQERGPMPSQQMPFSSSSSFMPSKYGPPFPHHMGMPPPGHAPPFPPPSMGVPPPPLGMPPPPMGPGGPPPFGMPPPISLLGPPPFNPGMHPPPGRDPLVRGNSPPGGINPMAFSTAPPGHKMPGMGEYSQPPPHTKPVPQQNPQMGRMTNNLSSMLTNALKAQVSKAQSTYNTGSPTSTPTKKPVPSLMSINIPGIPKPGPSGSQK